MLQYLFIFVDRVINTRCSSLVLLSFACFYVFEINFSLKRPMQNIVFRSAIEVNKLRKKNNGRRKRDDRMASSSAWNRIRNAIRINFIVRKWVIKFPYRKHNANGIGLPSVQITHTPLSMLAQMFCGIRFLAFVLPKPNLLLLQWLFVSESF